MHAVHYINVCSMCLAIIYQSIIHGCSKGVLEFTTKVTPIIGYTFVCLSLMLRFKNFSCLENFAPIQC